VRAVASSTPFTELLERVPLDDIGETARRITPGRTVAALAGGVLFAAGWLIAVIFGGLWFVAKWSFAAALVGWKTARHEEILQPDIVQLLRENEMLRAEAKRDDISQIRAENERLRAEVQRLGRLR